MIPAQTWLVAVAACVLLVAVWSWGIVREDAANQAGFDAGRLAGAAEERQRARRGVLIERNRVVADGKGSGCDSLPARSHERPANGLDSNPAPSTLSDAGATGECGAIPAFLRTPNETEG